MVATAYLNLARRFGRFPYNTVINDLFLEMLELLFTEEEAEVTAAFPALPVTAARLASKVDQTEAETASILDRLAERGLILAFGEGRTRRYTLVPVVPGLFEMQMCCAPETPAARRFAELYEEYFVRENVPSSMERPFSFVKVVPIGKSVANSIGVLPTDSLREAVDRHKVWALARSCACRHQRGLIGRSCGLPREVCMGFGGFAEMLIQRGFMRPAAKAEILEALDRAEAAGLVHITDNLEFPSFCCNCCSCCCGFLATVNRFNLPGFIAHSRYRADLDPSICQACGKCASHCPTGALRIYNKQLVYEGWRCLGCGVCATQCPHGAVRLAMRDRPAPIPENYGQLLATVAADLVGLRQWRESLPGFTRFLGNGIQKLIMR